MCGPLLIFLCILLLSCTQFGLDVHTVHILSCKTLLCIYHMLDVVLRIMNSSVNFVSVSKRLKWEIVITWWLYISKVSCPKITYEVITRQMVFHM